MLLTVSEVIRFFAANTLLIQFTEQNVPRTNEKKLQFDK